MTDTPPQYLLLVDDESAFREVIAEQLTDHGFKVKQAGTGEDALERLSEFAFDVLVTDLRLPGVDGRQVLDEAFARYPDIIAIVISGYGTLKEAVEVTRRGAEGFITKPFQFEELLHELNVAIEKRRLRAENAYLRAQLQDKFKIDGIIGRTPAMDQLFELLRTVAATNSTVLITGETGTGKELAARAIHDGSARRAQRFVAINCSAIPETLLEAELFGHEKGSFTGALAQVQGKVEYAQNGTLFLDEIGELPALLQVKLLRFLQDKTIQRVGGREDVVVNTRILAATNKDLTKEIGEGRFREDLYYRLGVVLIKVPPLRDRIGDLVVLATYFLKRYCDLYNKRVRGYNPAALESMETYAWPGNIRELENKIQRAIILSEGPFIGPHDLGFDSQPMSRNSGHPENRTLREAKERVEKAMVMSALDNHVGNIAKAAEELGISRPTLYDIMKRHGLFNGTLHQENANHSIS